MKFRFHATLERLLRQKIPASASDLLLFAVVFTQPALSVLSSSAASTAPLLHDLRLSASFTSRTAFPWLG